MADAGTRAALDDLTRRIGIAAAVDAARALGNRAAYRYLQRCAAERRARELLDQGVQRAVVNERLVVAFQIDRRTAERRSAAALRQPPSRTVAR